MVKLSAFPKCDGRRNRRWLGKLKVLGLCPSALLPWGGLGAGTQVPVSEWPRVQTLVQRTSGCPRPPGAGLWELGEDTPHSAELQSTCRGTAGHPHASAGAMLRPGSVLPLPGCMALASGPSRWAPVPSSVEGCSVPPRAPGHTGSADLRHPQLPHTPGCLGICRQQSKTAV